MLAAFIVIFNEDRIPLTIDAGGMAHIRFPLPADGPATCLSDVPTRYWELVVQAEFPGPDYEGVFLVPVYASAPDTGMGLEAGLPTPSD